MRETWKCLYLVSKLHNLDILYNVFILKVTPSCRISALKNVVSNRIYFFKWRCWKHASLYVFVSQVGTTRRVATDTAELDSLRAAGIECFSLESHPKLFTCFGSVQVGTPFVEYRCPYKLFSRSRGFQGQRDAANCYL